MVIITCTARGQEAGYDVIIGVKVQDFAIGLSRYQGMTSSHRYAKEITQLHGLSRIVSSFFKKHWPPSFPGSSLYLEKVPWLRLVTCLYMPTTDAQRVGPQQTSTFQPLPSIISLESAKI